MAFTYQEKLILEDGYVVVLLTGNRAHDDAALFVYLITDKQRLEALDAQLRTQPTVVFKDYGSVLHSGFGEATEADEAYMQQQLQQAISRIIDSAS